MHGIRDERCETSDAPLSLKRTSVDSTVSRSAPVLLGLVWRRPSLRLSLLLSDSSRLACLAQKKEEGALSQPGRRSEVSTLGPLEQYNWAYAGCQDVFEGCVDTFRALC
jgi:hypothetical protein